jgi:trimeric autotransporter adhesin
MMLFSLITIISKYKKTIPLSIAFALLTTLVWAQTDLKVGTTPGSITTSAVFEAASTTKGLLMPRMTTAQMNAIATPANGLMIYNTTDNCTYIFRSGTGWVSTCSPTYTLAWGLTGNSGTTAGTNFIGTTDAQDFVIKAFNTEGLRLYQSNNGVKMPGHVAVGANSAIDNGSLLWGGSTFKALLSAQEELTGNLTVDYGVGLIGYLQVNPLNNPTTLFIGIDGEVETKAGNASNISTASGIFGSFTHRGTGTVASSYAFEGYNSNTGSGTLTEATGISAKITNNAAGNINNSYGGYFYGGNVGAGTISNYHGIYIANPTNSGGGTLTNNYGLLIENMTTGTNRYAIYSMGGQSYHAGNFGIGSTAPAYKLDIVGSNPLRLVGLNAGAITDSLLTSASGVVRRLGINDLLSNAWNITGNSNITDGTHFIGTTNNIPLSIRVNNLRSGYIDPSATQSTFLGYRAGINNNPALGSGNTAIGHQSLSANTSGISNTAIGVNTLNANLTGGSNVVIGINALRNATNPSYNVAIGEGVMSNATGGEYNTVVGASAMSNNTTGSNNTALGLFTLQSNTTGQYNVAVGSHTLIGNTTGGNNIGMGHYTLRFNTTGQNNIGIGRGALESATTASSNVAIGLFAMGNAATTGNNNIGIGEFAMYRNTSGFDNIGIGRTALSFNTTGQNNVGLGIGAVYSNTTGNNNVGLGANALYAAVTVSNNTAIGAGSLQYATGGNNTSLGYNALNLNTTGTNNVAVGNTAGITNTTGANNTFIGFQANASGSTLTNATAIGANATVGASNSMVLGGTGANAVNVGINTSTPQYKLDIDAMTTSSGNPLRLLGLNAGATTDSLVTSAAGIVRRMHINDMAWTLRGNTGTNWMTNYLGTADQQSLRFRTNNIQRMMIDSTFGNASIGQEYYSNVKLNLLMDEGQTSIVGSPTGIFNQVRYRQNASFYQRVLGINNDLRINILAGVTNAGGYEGIVSRTLRESATDAGSVNFAKGMAISYGHHTGLAGAATTANATGLHIEGYKGGGTITNMRDLYLSTLQTGATVTNHWALYQENPNANNYFAGNTGIGTTTPQYKLDIDASTGSSGNPLRLLGLNTGTTADSLLSASSGIVRRLSISDVVGSNAWSLLGNTGTNENTNFVGTTDNKALSFRVNNIWAGRLDHAKDNVFLGYQAGVNTTGAATENTFIGHQAGQNVTSGRENLLIGYQAGGTMTTANANQFIGFQAGFSNTSGSENTATGYQAGYSLTTGNYNAFIGKDAGRSNTSGFENTALGFNALRANTTTNGNVAIGTSAMLSSVTGSDNVAIGRNALRTSTGASYNVAVGSGTMNSTVTGTYNTALGNAAMGALTSGNYNVALGATSLSANTTGASNIAIGGEASLANTTGSNNVSLGYQAHRNGTTVSNGTFIGYQSGMATTGNNNTFLGYQTGATNTTGSSNTLLGYNTNVGSAALTNATAVGADAVVSASNSLVLGNNANVGIGTSTPSVRLDVDGAVAIRPLAASITADNQAVTVGNRSFLRLTSNGTPANRTVTLSNGTVDGQQLVIRVSGTGANGIELADSGNLNLTGLAQLDDGDTLTLIWDGTIWYEMYRSNN